MTETTNSATIEHRCLAMARSELKRVLDRVIEKPIPDALTALTEQARKYQECWIDFVHSERISP